MSESRNLPGSGPLDGLFEWADRQPQPHASARVVDLLRWRETSGRWRILIKPRGETAAAALLRFDRRAGLEPPAPILPFTRRAGKPA